MLWDEWMILQTDGIDEQIIHTMTDGVDEHISDSWRAAPYVGLIDSKIRDYIFSKSLACLPTMEELTKFNKAR